MTGGRGGARLDHAGLAAPFAEARALDGLEVQHAGGAMEVDEGRWLWTSLRSDPDTKFDGNKHHVDV